MVDKPTTLSVARKATCLRSEILAFSSRVRSIKAAEEMAAIHAGVIGC
ncbi:hypothetical protein SAMN04487974_1395 [Pelagibacterium luteolum]|uniref:Uncharacterized protein n=1 Tax=Pelagibacterium luteolum TaxID=440168 RepID=A0A1G8ASP5_9HYPH|nr:hypothetical protein SAMN04487974_1395 [Pelagibacterium luteolum]